jgi:hypothetical protein
MSRRCMAHWLIPEGALVGFQKRSRGRPRKAAGQKAR